MERGGAGFVSEEKGPCGAGSRGGSVGAARLAPTRQDPPLLASPAHGGASPAQGTKSSFAGSAWPLALAVWPREPSELRARSVM